MKKALLLNQGAKEFSLYDLSLTDLADYIGVQIARHSGNKGSILTFDEYGKTTKLLVADAQYRTKKQFGTFSTDSSLTNFNSVENSNGWCLSPDNDHRNQPENPPILTVKELQAMWPALAGDKTARANCDVWMTYKGKTDSQNISGVPAVEYARSLTSIISGGMDLPNEYQLMLLFICGNIIDALDPTVASYPKYALGNLRGDSNKRWHWDGSEFCWSSTEYRSNHVRSVRYDGDCGHGRKDYTGGVCPVREL